MGSNNIIISSIKSVEDDAATTQHSHMSIYGLTYEDRDRIAESFSHIDLTAPVKVMRKEARLEERSIELRIVGTTEQWFDLVPREILAGRVLLASDLEKRVPVAVLTEFGARKILATQNTVGEKIRIGSDYFEVVGIVRSEGGQAGNIQMPDEEVDVYIPMTAGRAYFGDITTRRTAGSFIRERVELHQIIARVDKTEYVESTAAGVERVLARFHKKTDYVTSVPLTLLRQAEATKRRFNIVLGSIAGISLLVGGIGIMNIMLASVTERTREIGIRRAIGAKRWQIITQFLIETVVLSTTGGIIGLGIGVLIPSLITLFSGMATVLTVKGVVFPLLISMSIGILFGIYPAMHAAKVDPIVALRHE